MKLKALLLRKRIDDKKKELEALRAKDSDFEKREAELKEAFEEINDETSKEEIEAVEEKMAEFDVEKESHEEAKKNLENEISETEKELADVEKKQTNAEPKLENEERHLKNENLEVRTMTLFRNKALNSMNHEQRTAFISSEKIKNFLENIRSLGRGQKIEERALTGGELLIPDVVLPLIRTSIETYSKLIKHVNLKKVSGKSRQNVEAGIPEAVWVEACAKLNELALKFTNVEVDAFKVGGFIPICNSTLEDSDIDLFDEVLWVLGQSIGYAIDKAIVYGTGVKMPTGFASKATKKNVSGKNDVELFKALVKATGSLKHSNGEKFWVMNDQTKTDLIAASLSINAAGALVAGIENKMPVIGGSIETLDFVPDGEILGGYGMNYLLAERSGITLGMSEHAQFIEDNTVFKGTARYDGKPVFEDSFVAIGLAGEPTAALDSLHPFAADKANG